MDKLHSRTLSNAKEAEENKRQVIFLWMFCHTRLGDERHQTGGMEHENNLFAVNFFDIV
jgi:hypothetical protein